MSEVSEIAPGEELEWEPLQGKTACRIAVYRPESSIFASEGAQDEMLRWSIERLLKFKEVFGPRLQSAVLKAEERLAAAAPEDTEAAELLDRPSD